MSPADFFSFTALGIADQIAISPFRFSREKKVYFGISKKSWMMKNLNRIQLALEAFIQSGEARAVLADYYTGHALPVPVM